MQTIKENNQNQIEIKNSKFITLLYKLEIIDDIKIYLNQAKQNYPNATHYCYAYIFKNQEKASDDGEPAKTAGIPILNILKKNNLDKILCIVVRYFGGINLGANGLIRAYSLSVKEALNNTKLIRLIEGYLVEFKVSYEKNQQLLFLLQNKKIVTSSYQETITHQVQIPMDEYQQYLDFKPLILKNIDIEKED